MTNIRAFIAIDIDEKNIVNRINQIQQHLWRTQESLKLVKPQNLHLTLKFLGNTQVALLEKVKLTLEEIAFHPFTINIQQIGGFPNSHHPRVIWAGIREEQDQLPKIADQLERKLNSLGFPPETRKFSPHLTIARVKTRRLRNEFITAIRELANIEVGKIFIKCLKLKKSELMAQGPIYTTLKKVCRTEEG